MDLPEDPHRDLELIRDFLPKLEKEFSTDSSVQKVTAAIRRLLRRCETSPLKIDEAHAAREQMLAIVSHDIKNPLSAIRLEAQMLLRVAERHGKSLLGEEVKIQAARILKTADRLRILISDLLDKNKKENSLSHLHKSPIPVQVLLKEVLEATRPLMNQKKIHFKLFIPSTDITLMADRTKMFQVLSNLLNNAIKFTPHEGTIDVEIQDQESEVHFSVSDSGPGLPQESLEHVFDKYWTGKLPGSSGHGLGLFICKTIVHAHGGGIWVSNLPIKGAKFTFSIPKMSEVSETDRPSSKKRIFIIDDDDDLREVLTWALSKEGFAVEAFQDPKLALQLLQNGKTLPHLILADYQMSGMKGGEFLSRKNEIQKARGCPVIMVSASPAEITSEVDKELYREIVTKPLDLEFLIENMKKYLC